MNTKRFPPTMASKSARGTTSATAAIGGALRVEVDRLIQKERFKDAVKQAKLCYKQESTPENHQLLERAYFLRARQLVQLGMRCFGGRSGPSISSISA